MRVFVGITGGSGAPSAARPLESLVATSTVENVFAGRRGG
jgi:3-polyprenyl-4-hydroxybenzoate decarboxylase